MTLESNELDLAAARANIGLVDKSIAEINIGALLSVAKHIDTLH